MHHKITLKLRQDRVIITHKNLLKHSNLKKIEFLIANNKLQLV